MELPLSKIPTEFKGFIQRKPEVTTNFDSTLEFILRRLLPETLYLEREREFVRFGKRCCEDISQHAERLRIIHPELRKRNEWGEEVNELILSDSWVSMKRISSLEGVISIGYDKSLGVFARIIQFAKLAMFQPVSGMFGCPLAMTDGVAKLLENIKSDNPLFIKAFKNLTSRDPKNFWTSGQWMTERGGGSDVAGGCRTLAKLQKDGSYRLWGYKWFSSSIDADMALALGRIENEQGEVIDGSNGISCFLVVVRDENGSLNNIRMTRLKRKMGTKQLPTAELELRGTKAFLVGKPGRGIPIIAGNLVNMTRVHCAFMCSSSMGRALSLVRSHVKERVSFGSKLATKSLMIETINSLEVYYRVCMQMCMDMARLCGRAERLNDSRAHALLRIVTPIAKAYTAKISNATLLECIEVFGGVGYLEGELSTLFLDAFVNTVWEGPTNIMVLDVQRVLLKERRSLQLFFEEIEISLIGIESEKILGIMRSSIKSLKDYVFQKKDFERQGRGILFGMARVYGAHLLLAQAKWSGLAEDFVVAEMFVTGSLQNEAHHPDLFRPRDTILGIDTIKKVAKL